MALSRFETGFRRVPACLNSSTSNCSTTFSLSVGAFRWKRHLSWLVSLAAGGDEVTVRATKRPRNQIGCSRSGGIKHAGQTTRSHGSGMLKRPAMYPVKSMTPAIVNACKVLQKYIFI